MSDYLTEKTKFAAINCPARFTGKEFGGERVYARGAKVLSVDAKLDLDGTRPQACPFKPPTTPPTPCMYVNGTAQLTGPGDFSHRLGKTPLATSACVWNCGQGGLIKVSSVGPSEGKFLQGSVGEASAEGEKSANESRAKDEGAKSAPAAETVDKSAAGDEEPKGEPAATNAEMEAPGRLKKDELHKNLRCRSCDQAEDCEKLKQILGGDYFSNSAALRRNYEKLIASRGVKPDPAEGFVWKRHPAENAWKRAREVEQEAGLRWSYAAHHLLSVKDVVAKDKALLSLIKAFEYDINNGDNCVMLLGKSGDVDFQELDESEKRVHKYHCLARGRMQWHGGGHTFKINPEFTSLIMARTSADPSSIKCYAELMREKLAGFVERWTKETPKVCPRDEKRVADVREDFWRELNRIADEVRLKLTEFRDDPRDSFPWYVAMID